jgi:hypothetical protein
VRSGGEESSVGAVTCGVPQGSRARSCLYHLLITSRGLSVIAVFTFLRMMFKLMS